MKVLILGPNGSGKSAYAEKLAVRLSKTRYYIATMIPYGDEGRARVEKHQKQRADMGFITVEKPFCVSAVPLPQDTVVLLEDVSNLLSNAVFDGDRQGSEDSVSSDITAMCAKCRHTVLVSIEGLAAESEYDSETRGYIDALNRLNQRLADFADAVIEMHDGEPTFVKGDACALD